MGQRLVKTEILQRSQRMVYPKFQEHSTSLIFDTRVYCVKTEGPMLPVLDLCKSNSDDPSMVTVDHPPPVPTTILGRHVSFRGSCFFNRVGFTVLRLQRFGTVIPWSNIVHMGTVTGVLGPPVTLTQFVLITFPPFSIKNSR